MADKKSGGGGKKKTGFEIRRERRINGAKSSGPPRKYPGADKVWDADHGKYRFFCKITGREYASQASCRGAQASAARTGKKEGKMRKPRTGARSYGAKLGRREGTDGIQGYTIPKTTNRVLEYLRRNMEQFGVGTLSEYDRRLLKKREGYSDSVRDRGRRQDIAEDYVAEMHKDVIRLLGVLYGENWRVLIRSTGMSDDLLAYLESPFWKRERVAIDEVRKVAAVMDPGHPGRGAIPEKVPWPVSEALMHLRHIVLIAMIHVKDIIDTTRELERELWVLLQQMHDQRIIPDDREARDRYTAGMMASETMRNLRMPMDHTTLMPLRARALLHYPEMALSDALRYEGEKLNPQYYSQRSEQWSVSDVHEGCDELISVSEEIVRFKDRVAAGVFDLDRERLEREWRDLRDLMDKRCSELEAKQDRLYSDMVERGTRKLVGDVDDMVRDRVARAQQVEDRAKRRVRKARAPGARDADSARVAKREKEAIDRWRRRFVDTGGIETPKIREADGTIRDLSRLERTKTAVRIDPAVFDSDEGDGGDDA